MSPLLQPDAERIMPVEHKPARDRAPEELALGGPLWLRDDLVELIGEAQVHSRLIDLVKYATDASPYCMFPKPVVSPRTVDEVKKVFAYAKEKELHVTIRAAGSSLSGQAQGDGILIDARKHWVGTTVEDGGRRLRVRPGTVMFRANLALHPYGYRLGPDPSSSGVATVGGVIANNASGMCCGTVENSYKTLESVSFLLPSGTEEVHEIGGQDFEQHICSNRTCELGMNLATGKDYRSVIFLLEESTRPAAQNARTAQNATVVA